MPSNRDWDKEVANWHERRNEDDECEKRKHHRRRKRDDDDCHDSKACDRSVSRAYEVSLPITVTPFAVPSEPGACCGGRVRVTQGHRRCGRNSNSHEFTVSQIINVEIPIEFGAVICYEDCCSEEHGRRRDGDQDTDE